MKVRWTAGAVADLAEIQEETVVISAVVHGRRDLAKLLSSVTERP
jgi:plasmid stabilization system protein ParE